jgi:hypothetical protein
MNMMWVEEIEKLKLKCVKEVVRKPGSRKKSVT